MTTKKTKSDQQKTRGAGGDIGLKNTVSDPNDTPIDAGTQRARIARYLREKGSLTTLYARNAMFIMSPASRIGELRERGWSIETARVGKRRYADYRLRSPGESA